MLLAMAALAGMGFLAAPPPAHAGWKPTKPVEIVVMASQGVGPPRILAM